MKNDKNILLMLTLMTSLLIMNKAYAAPITITEMLGNLQSTWGSLFLAVQTFSFVVGIALFVMGLHKATLVAKEKAESKSVFFYILAGVLLVNVGGLFDAITLTMGLDTNGNWGSEGLPVNDLFVHADTQNALYEHLQGGESQAAFKSIVSLIKVVGFIAIIRGLLILKEMGNPRSQNAGLGKALLHIVPGSMLMNIVQVGEAFANSVGLRW